MTWRSMDSWRRLLPLPPLSGAVDSFDGTLVEKADVEQLRFGAAAKDILEDAALVGHGIVLHQLGGPAVNLVGVVGRVVVLLIELAPQQSFLLTESIH